MRDHRRFADAPWALPAERVDRIEEQLRRFQGTDTAQDLAWLFANYVELPDPGSCDAAAEQQAVAQRQEEAVRDLIADGGIAAIWELAARCEAPRLLGFKAGRVTADLDEIVIAELDSEDQGCREAAMGWSAGRFEAAGWPWAAQHLDHADTWLAPRAAAFLRSLPPTARIFDWALMRMSGHVEAAAKGTPGSVAGAALRALGEMSPEEQEQVLQFMNELQEGKGTGQQPRG